MDKKKVSEKLIDYLTSKESDIVIPEEFKDITLEDIQSVLQLITGNDSLSTAEKNFYLNNLWKIHYKKRPPTPEEFLSPKYLGPNADNIYPHVKEKFLEFMNPGNAKRYLYLSPAIGWGKSYLSVLSTLYIIVHVSLMKNPKKFFNLSQASSIVVVLGSFSLQQAQRLLLQPFLNFLRSSPFFPNVKREDRLSAKQDELEYKGEDGIPWTTASRMGGIQFPNDIHIAVVSDPANLLGMSILIGVLSELSFFMDKGISPEEIHRMHNDLKRRIESRFQGNFFARLIIDTSPNSFDSPIDKYVFGGEAEKEPMNMVVTSTKWDAQPYLYDRWRKTGETFKVYRGAGGSPPKILDDFDDASNFTPEEVYNVPIDLRSNAEADLLKFVKDFCGWPAGSYDKLISDFSIIDKMFYPNLKNIYTYIKAPADMSPEGLIWQQIKSKFFVEVSRDKYEFYRYPNEWRYISVDQSEVTDMTSISMVHPEVDNRGNMLIVTDFTIAIVPDKNRINLDSIYEFIIDLKKKGNIYISKVTFDRYQSSAGVQRLKREEIDVENFSVDTKKEPYYTYVSWIKNRRVKTGKNVFLKNNLKSIQEVKRDSGSTKIDHLKGQVVYDDGAKWETTLMGINAKDISDSHCAAVVNCIGNYKGIPMGQWDEEEMLEEGKSEKLLLEKSIGSFHEQFGYFLQ